MPRPHPPPLVGTYPWCTAWWRAQGYAPRWAVTHTPWQVTLTVAGASGTGPTWLAATRACAQALGLPTAALPDAAGHAGA